MGEQPPRRSYKKTLNLPSTDFSMKANLVQREPQFQKRWEGLDLYARMRAKEHPKGRFSFHDGPPYANGEIHLGHLLNKVLKDLVVRTRLMAGYDVDFVPGWDCHGLPIEHKVLQELGEKAAGMAPLQIREKCRSYAERYVRLQSKQMQRLGTIGSYSDPYLTMSPRYEAAVLEVFASLVGAGLVFRSQKPVHWSIENRTALAEAELEYYEREDVSIYVLFEIADPSRLPPALDPPPGEPVDLMIWTTTPWTLPGNQAVAVSGTFPYALYRFECAGRSRHAILAEPLGERVLAAGGARGVEKLGECRGAELAAARLRYRHPFIDDGADRPVVTAGYVTLEDGTGLVHTAPGHGAEDYATGVSEGLPLSCPVRDDGTFDESVPDWLAGRSVWDGNRIVVERLRASGRLFHDHVFTHSYPHDWRSKTPIIFRATEQWFVGVDQPVARFGGRTLRQLALDVTRSDVRFVPEWGRNRMRGMLETRPDWCLSRQRSWGLPIPAFFGPEHGQVLLTAASVRAVADRVRERASNVWFESTAAELLASYDPTADPDAPDWLRGTRDLGSLDLEKSSDIFDVWFESGSSWNAVVRERELGYPADLYLEGSDQHRGWFQLSLLPALGVTGRAPFRALLTHGFIVDAQGMKMSKSGGNALAVEDLLRDYGADVCRWWVSSLNYANDVKADNEFFRLAGEEYRKVRNTIRFLLGNLQDFDPSRDRRALRASDRHSMDAWAMGELDKLIGAVCGAYQAYQFRSANRAIFHFCNDAMSAVYLAAAKDRLYCDRADSERRRRCQTVMHEIADALIRLIAPLLVHTAEEAYLSLYRLSADDRGSAHLQSLPAPRSYRPDAAWPEVMATRERVLKALEEARSGDGLDNPLDAGIELRVPAREQATLEPFRAELPDLCGVSRFELISADNASLAVVDLRGEPRCERSWKRDGTVALRSDGGWLSNRDAEAVGV